MTDVKTSKLTEDCEYDALSYDVFDFDIKKRSEKKQKVFEKKIDGLSVWNVGNSKKSKLRELSLMKIPPRSIEVLSKFIVNHHLEEIKSVVKVGTKTTVLHAKSNHQHKVYHNLESNDVIIKIFTQKNHTKPDVEAAKNSEVIVFSKNRNKGKLPHVGFFSHLTNIDCECLNIEQIENVVILKMIGANHPAKTLINMIKENPQKLQSYYRELLGLIRFFKYRDERFWRLKASMQDILWHNNQWMLISHANRNDDNKNDDCIASNLVSFVKTFHSYGLSNEELKKDFLKLFVNIDESELHYNWQHDKPMNINSDMKKIHQKTISIHKLLGHDKCLKLLDWNTFDREKLLK
jgi:hypothetical protein